MNNPPTRETAAKFCELAAHGMTNGLGTPEPGHTCVMGIMALATGSPFRDTNECVGALKEIERTPCAPPSCGMTEDEVMAVVSATVGFNSKIALRDAFASAFAARKDSHVAVPREVVERVVNRCVDHI